MASLNFFMVGAPKTATTALSQYLRMHPNVFMCEPKEPYYFSSDIGPSPYARDLRQYLGLFAAASPQHTVVAEASTIYLSSNVACQRIFDFNPEAKILVTLRNPVDLVHAWHSEMLYAGEESVKDFTQAWALQERRARGKELSHLCARPPLLQYKKIGMLGAGLKKYVDQFGKSRVCWILFDDFAADPRAEYLRLLDFLQLPIEVPQQFTTFNSNKRHRSPVLGKSARFLRQRLARPMNAAFSLVGMHRSGLMDRLDRINTRKVERPPIPLGVRQQLQAEFRSDIQLLESLIGRDLSFWYH
jgi:hypothetical protein